MELVWTTRRSDPVKAAGVGISVADRIMRNNPEIKNFAAVFDIDETLLRNGENFGKGENEISIQPAGFILFKWCTNKNLPIILVTARSKRGDAREYALEQLRALGYDLSQVKQVWMNPKGYDELGDAGAAFKRQARKKIAEKYTILLNAGDRWTDVAEAPPVSEYDKDAYYGVKPVEHNYLHAIKFPENDA